jgi:hypothetical protein
VSIFDEQNWGFSMSAIIAVRSPNDAWPESADHALAQSVSLTRA